MYLPYVNRWTSVKGAGEITFLSKRDSLTVSTLACHAADPGSNPAQGDNFFN